MDGSVFVFTASGDRHQVACLIKKKKKSLISFTTILCFLCVSATTGGSASVGVATVPRQRAQGGGDKPPVQARVQPPEPQRRRQTRHWQLLQPLHSAAQRRQVKKAAVYKIKS